MTNKQFAAVVGCHFSTASRYRNGNRLPQVQYLERIRDMIGVSHDEIMSVWSQGAEVFGAYLRVNVFGDEQQEAA